MSKLFKSKFALGLMVAALVVVGAAKSAKAADCSITMILKQGMSGAEVSCLQMKLGVTPATGYFGNITKGKVIAFQAANGLAQVGQVGPMTRALLNGSSAPSTTPVAGCAAGAMFNSMTGAPCSAPVATPGCPAGAMFNSMTGAACGNSTTNNGPLAGTAGSIASMSQLSQYSGEEVGAGQTGVKVMGFEVEASNDGDIALNSVKLVFDSTGNASGDSDRITDYITSVSVWEGSTKVATVSTADFSKDSTGIYKKVVSLSNAVVRADKTEKFYVSVDAVSNLDSGDIDSDSWTIALENVRYSDGAGVVSTEVTAIPAAMDYDSAGDGVAIAFVSLSSAADTEVQFSLDTTSPKENSIDVDTTNTTDNVVLMKGKIKVKGTSNVWIDELPVMFTTDATNVDAVAPSVTLKINGEEYSKTMTSSAGTTESITFDDLDLTINAGSTIDFSVSADIEDIEAGVFDEAIKLKAEVGSTQRGAAILENSEGDALTDGTEVTGTSLGEYQHFFSIAPSVEVVSASITPNDNGSSAPISATAKMKLKVTAMGGDIYLNGGAESTSGKEFVQLAADGGDASSAVSAVSSSYTVSGTYTVTNSGSDNEYYTLSEGNSMTIEVTSIVTQAAGSSSTLVGMKASSLLFGTDSTSDTTRSAKSLNWTTLTDLLKTGKVTLR